MLRKVVWCIVAWTAIASVQWGQGSCNPLIPPEKLPSTNATLRAEPEEYRLTDDIVPSHYDIEIRPYFEQQPNRSAFSFDGSTTITVTAAVEKIEQIKLHTSYLDLLSVSVLRKSNSSPVPLTNRTYDEETEVLTLNLGMALLRNVEYLLVFSYVGQMEDDMRGFYRSYYTVNGTKVWLGTTQFEQMEARKAFPCFDEPKFKSRFDLKIVYQFPKYNAWANTPMVRNDSLGGDLYRATFATTPVMSTYLLAFIVAPYEKAGDELVPILARPEAINQTAYASSEGGKLLRHLGTWIDYPFDDVPEIKSMAMAAIPDFAAGAMENWGLITYRESALLYVSDEATSLQQQRVATIIAHELAHQWFGNLVTCEWWNVTWLNEGFATYLEYFGTDSAEPSWEVGQQFIVDKLQSAMQMDGWAETHPMTHPVYTNAQAAAIFDAISYNKGGVVLRMMEHYLTSVVFQTALREYVKERAFNTAQPEDLFRAFDRHNANASEFIKPWTTQPGYPLVTVISDAEGFNLTQRRFLYNGTTDNNEVLTWPLPITYATTEQEFTRTKPTIVTSPSFQIKLANASELPYFVLNNQQAFYYRVNYDEELWTKIGNALRSDRFGGIHVLNRAQIVDDLFNLARADIVSYERALDLLDYLRKETEFLPWLAAANGLSTLSQKIHEEDEALFTNYVLDLFAEAYELVKFQEPTNSERRVHIYLRRLVLDWTCRYGHEGCSKEALREFEKFRVNPQTTKVHPDIRQTVYCEGVRRGTSEQYSFLLSRYLSTNVATEQQMALQGLSCATRETLIHQFLNLTSSDDVRQQDKGTALSLLLGNPSSLPAVVSYLTENHARWADAHGSYRYVGQTFQGVLIRTKSATLRDTIRTFAQTNEHVLGPEAYELILNGLQQYEVNEQFILNHRNGISAFLKRNDRSAATVTVVSTIGMVSCLALLIVGRLMRLVDRLVLVAIVACGCIVVSQSSPLDPDRYLLVEAEPRAALDDYRLNEDVWPSHYDIEITPYFADEGTKKAFTFDGRASIRVKTTLTGISTIKLHMARMEITQWSITRAQNGADVPRYPEAYDPETEILTLTMPSPLTPNEEYQLNFVYVGNMDDDMHGFYRSYYLVDGQKVWMGSTQFQQTHARRAFPCFDEPRYKATWSVKIIHTAQYNVFSNTPIINTVSNGAGRTITTFAKTPSMSSYLVAFIVAPYEVTSRDEMGILARPQAQNQTAYSLDVGLKLLRALGDMVGYPFTSVPEMTRMYMAAIPDFSAGAMENWGLLTYRETNILYREDDSTSMQQQRIAAVISHEIAHQWFGDLLTCEWWDVTWLNEGFARYFQYFGTQLVEQNWDLEHQFVVEQLQGVMQMDSLRNTRPMTHPVYTQAQASGVFDNISYNKGAVMLRLLEHLLTPERFRTALREYVRDNAYRAVRPDDLFTVLNRFEATVKMHLEPWTVQGGYPLVTVTSTDKGFTLTQRRFLVNELTHNDDTLWSLPITYATKAADFANTQPTFHEGATITLEVAGAADAPYFILNNQQVGYYRVNYDAGLWAKISKALQSDGFGGIHVLNRAQLVDDLFNLARGDVVPYGTALEILEYLKEETEYAPWLAAVNGLTTLARRVHEEDEQLFKHHILDIFGKVYGIVKFQPPANGERRVRTYLRQNVLQWACNYGHEECSEAAVMEFERFFKNPTVKVNPDLRQVVYCEGIRKGTRQHFEFLWNQYLTTNMATEQILILQGLACASSKELVDIMLDAITTENIRPQDKSNAYTYVINNAYTLPHVSAYLQQNHAIWAAAHGSYLNVASAFNNLLARLKNDAEKNKISAFIETNKAVLGTAAYDSIKRGLDDYEANKQFTTKNRDEIRDFLKKKADGGAATVLVNVSLIVSLVMFALSRQ
uniref:Aminopeptidase N n=3 Tax=Anopheles albimanus TaxID=7167 RepID=A0A182F8D7_ANOAL